MDADKFSFYVLSSKKLNGIYIPWSEDAVKTAKKTGTFRVYFMSSEDQTITSSVGSAYGDSTFIVFPNGETMLIDGGKTAYGQMLVRNLKELGVKKIDHLVLSHLHEDHYGGIFGSVGVLNEFEIGTFYWTGVESFSEDVTNTLLNKAGKKAEKTCILNRGDSFEIGGVLVDVLFPTSDMRGRVADSSDATLNNKSLVLRFTYNDFKYMTCGDLYVDSENNLIDELGSDELDVDLLKANHHGKMTSNCKDWAKATTPKVVVTTSGIAMDLNPYGYYSMFGAYVLNDKIDGYVRVVTDGNTCEVTNSREKVQSVNDNFDSIARKIFPVTVKTVNK